ncbi:MAG: sigma-70 family RNA polymerase sigma factor [Bacteroidetes bacterium]|jgi:RNA polymerase sigma-70 factor (ECF subfamily)|nr:sigma-70 family RNA polymerase sigma factor [Bacteroidota bacterium]
MKKSQSDSEIIASILDGKPEMYRVLVKKYSPMVFHLIRSFEQNEEEVKGMAQDIFVKTYTKLGSFEDRSKFSTWIYSLALNYCRDYAKNIRRKTYRFGELEESFIDDIMSDAPQPDEFLEQRETEGELLRVINKLPPEQSAPLLMKYRDGMSYKAISEQTGVSESALKVRLYRARLELQRDLKKEVLK